MRKPERFFAALDVGLSPAGCWIWTRSVNRSGYGQYDGSLAHRLVYELLVGPIPSGHQIDHLCRTPGCVNPLHLEPVTPAENSRRSIKATRSTCVSGHSYTPENTYHRPGGYRECRICRRIRKRRFDDALLVANRALAVVSRDTRSSGEAG